MHIRLRVLRTQREVLLQAISMRYVRHETAHTLNTRSTHTCHACLGSANE